MDASNHRHALDEPVHSHGRQSDVESWDPLTDTPRSARLRRQFRWLVVIAVANLSVLAIDLHSLGDSFSTAVTLRLLVVTPLVLLGLGINRWSSNHHLQTAASACATVSLVAATAVIGQLAPEPFASRYLMAGLFAIFAAAVFAALPWRATQIMTVISTAAYTLIVASALQLPPRMVNLDLVGSNILIAVLALYIRREKGAQMNEIQLMRRIDAGRAAELRSANARLSELSSTDALTGAFNRRYLDLFADSRSTSIVPSLSSGVLMIDVDHFKLFNDLGGHAEGDRCLQLVAAAIRSALRSPDDIVVRYGGGGVRRDFAGRGSVRNPGRRRAIAQCGKRPANSSSRSRDRRLCHRQHRHMRGNAHREHHRYHRARRQVDVCCEEGWPEPRFGLNRAGSAD